jgi:hypothetical protein
MTTQNNFRGKLIHTYEEPEPASYQTSFGLKYYQVGTFNANRRSQHKSISTCHFHQYFTLFEKNYRNVVYI